MNKWAALAIIIPVVVMLLSMSTCSIMVADSCAKAGGFYQNNNGACVPFNEAKEYFQ